jgi:GTPase SAR1 family protein
MIVDDVEYSYTIWDTAGQEKFRTLLDIFYKGSDGCFLVFDLTDRKTFEKVIEWRD